MLLSGMDLLRFPGANVQAEPPFGIEPKTFRLQGGCSTTELGRHYLPAHYVSDEEIEEILSAEQL